MTRCFGRALGTLACAALISGAAQAAAPADRSRGCGVGGERLYAAGRTTAGQLRHDRLLRTFRVHVPRSYRPTSPLPLVLMLTAEAAAASSSSCARRA